MKTANSNDSTSNLLVSTPISTTSQIVFIDSGVADYQTLANSVVANTEVVILDSNCDGVKQISRVLSRKAYSKVHIVSHGSPGCLYLGDSQLSLDTWDRYAEDLKIWFTSPRLYERGGYATAQENNLFLYGCNVAAVDAGAEFIAKLTQATGAEIAASTTPIGNLAEGGNWDLDVSTFSTDFSGNFNSVPFKSEFLATYSEILIGGRVFNDISNDGEDDSEAGVSGVTIKAYDSSGNLAETTTSDGTGAYSFTTLTNGEPYRIEFDLSTLPSGYLEGFIGTDSDGSITFADGGDTGIDFGLSEKPLDTALVRTYGMAVTCGVDETSDYVFALTNAPSLSYNSATYNTNNGLQEFHHEDWTLERIGNIYFTEFDSKGNIFAPASRFTENSEFSGGLQQYGSIGGSDAIYKMDAITGTPTEWATLSQAGGGNTDAGMGGITYDPDTDSMYVVNMHDNTIYRITGSDSTTGTVEADTYTPSLGTSTHAFDGVNNTTFQNVPFGLDIYDGRLYYTVHDATGGGSLVVRSVGLNADGTINTADDREDVREVMSNNFNAGNNREGHPVVADIDFSPTGQMAVSSFSSGPYTTSTFTEEVNYYEGGDGSSLYNHTASNYIYELSASTWGRTAITSVGQATYVGATPNATATGGIAWDPNAGSQETLWMSGGDFAGEDGEWGVIGYNSTQLDNIENQENATDYIQFLFPNQNTSDPKGNGGEVDIFGFAMSIGNRIWNDADSDGIQDADETGLANVTVSLYDSSGTKVGEVDTDALGKYVFDNSNVTLNGATGVVPNSDYEVRLEDGTDFTGKSLTIVDVLGDDGVDSDAVENSGTPTIFLTTGDPGENNYTYDIGLIDGTLSTTYDYGDAPDTVSGTATGDYQTTASDSGAAHRIDLTASTLYIGTSVDSDDGTQQNIAADADDTLDGSDDENGVTFTFADGSSLKTGDTTISADVTVFNNTGNDATLVGWIDVDRSGTFDSDEAVETTISSSPSSSTPTLTWNSSNGFPNDITEGISYARFRLSTDSSLNTSTSIGTASDGEVEDYQITIDRGTDYGDAPDDGDTANGAGEYDTFASNDGPSHGIVSGLSIGSLVDRETDAAITTTDATATGDDTTDLDDEDGVTFISTLSSGDTSYSVDVDVTNTTGSDGLLTGWIDFDRSGTFDTDESVSATFSSSGTQTLTWDSLPGLVEGTTYARFRLATATTNVFSENFDSYSSPFNEVDTGWDIDPNDDDTADPTTINESGDWEIGNSNLATRSSGTYTVELDAFSSNNALVTGLAANSNNGDNHDLDGDTTVNSPEFTLLNSSGLYDLSFRYYIASDDNAVGTVDNEFSVKLFTSDNVERETFYLQQPDSDDFTANWELITESNLNLDAYAGQTVYLQFYGNDGGTGDMIEFGVDDINLDFTPTVNSTGALDSGEVEDYQLTVQGADYGDAPDTISGTATGDYETTSANGGASHTIDNDILIGTTIDADDGTQQSTAADADVSDEDGFTNPLISLDSDASSYSLSNITVKNDTGETATLIGWIDFDRDGVFSSDETATTTVDDGVTTANLAWNSIPADVADGTTYARFRFSTDNRLSTSYSTGELSDGEVEDYQIAINGIDYGDAPDDGVAGNSTGDYNTLSTNSGASHIISGDLALGSSVTSVDGDSGTSQNIGATADDTEDGNDDEDSIAFFSTLDINDANLSTYSYTVNVDVANDTGGDATLIGWIDFDGSGTFDADESVIVNNIADNNGVGSSVALTWDNDDGSSDNDIPSGLTSGTTYARFRLSSDFNSVTTRAGIDSNTPLDRANDGEVEDYAITIEGGTDYGDAPDDGDTANGAGEYDTFSSNNGPSHSIVSGLSIGSIVDAETDAAMTTTDITATGDDTTDSDDEDGVTFIETTVISTNDVDNSYSVDVEVTNTTGSDALLTGWIDFDRSGTFDTDEIVTTTFSNSGTQTISWFGFKDDIVTTGDTYARFRLASTETIFIENFDSYSSPFNEVDTGWDINPNDDDTADPTTTNESGDWEIGNSNLATRSSGTYTVELDAFSGNNALVTGLAANSNNGDNHDLDGDTTVNSPEFTLSSNSGLYDLSFRYYLASDDNAVGTVDNEFSVKLFTSDDVERETLHIQQPDSDDFTANWELITESNLNLDAYAGQTVYLQFYGNDGGTGDMIEFGVDDINLDFINIDPTGALNNGEVEDYQLSIKNGVNGTDSAEEINTTTTIATTSGNDLIIAGKGEDTLTGGGGNDCYHFNETSDGIDTITDFTPGEDKIDLSAILADEVTAYTSGDPFAQGYVELVELTFGGTTSTIVQIDFDGGDETLASDLYHKDIAFLQGVALSTLDTSRDFIL